ncbi:hypothetical protein GCM10010468_35510 [Actinocorallia longicatena]|uniref:Secreted protein n=2 Tax=Actinocorallia longicatena TaxID=111803 RepID=A0ABP6Q9Z7_9ACTN
MLLAAAVAPVALFGALPAHADTTDGPTAALLRGATAQTPVADLADPVVSGPAKVVDGLVTTTQGNGRVSASRTGAQDVFAELGTVAGDALGLKMDGLSSRCVTTSKGAMRAVTKITGGSVQGRRLPRTPVANTKVPLLDGAMAIFNKQTKDAEGALTVTGMHVTDRTGKVSELAVAKCVPAQRIVASARRKGGDPVSALLTDLLGGRLPGPAGPALQSHADRVNGFGGVTDQVTGLAQGLPIADPARAVESLTGGLPAAGLPGGARRSTTQGLPDVLPVGQGDTLSGLLGGLPGTPGTLPAGIGGLLPALPIG